MILNTFMSMFDSAPEMVFAILLLSALFGTVVGWLILGGYAIATWWSTRSLRKSARRAYRARVPSSNRGIL